MRSGYRIVTATIVRVNAISFVISTPNGEKVIATSLIHGADERQFGQLPRGPVEPFKHTFRLMEWKAEEVGLA